MSLKNPTIESNNLSDVLAQQVARENEVETAQKLELIKKGQEVEPEKDVKRSWKGNTNRYRSNPIAKAINNRDEDFKEFEVGEWWAAVMDYYDLGGNHPAIGLIIALLQVGLKKYERRQEGEQPEEGGENDTSGSSKKRIDIKGASGNK